MFAELLAESGVEIHTSLSVNGMLVFAVHFHSPLHDALKAPFRPPQTAFFVDYKIYFPVGKKCSLYFYELFTKIVNFHTTFPHNHIITHLENFFKC